MTIFHRLASSASWKDTIGMTEPQTSINSLGNTPGVAGAGELVVELGGLTPEARGPDKGAVRGVFKSEPDLKFRSGLARIRCFFEGHLYFRSFEKRRLSLKCAWCGKQTPGWEVGKPVTTLRFPDPCRMERLPNGLKVWRQ